MLRGEVVTLEPLTTDHVDDLVAAASEDRGSYGFTIVPSNRAETVRYVDALLAAADRGETWPFVQRRVADGRVVGTTRYLEPRRWFGRDHPDEIEIGGTWLAASAQRTALNTEAKLLLLTHAFDAWEVGRVAICTDARNERSRRAIERLGARLDGVLPNHRPSMTEGEPGQLRDTATYSIVPADWPTVRAGLLARLGRAPA